ncbi:protein COP1 SUPPRESSOR 2 isoform X3 [Coffea arabica]|uniref:Protein COP1 SUPPRESSOR 2 isoform X3 n=1 Tax=Coffea arabica TaxID=13443 RepID=A0ABM4WKK5_COFAR|nr:protein COP1 SUPPRESSOR 2-like isoform X2 [Coffea arabica]
MEYKLRNIEETEVAKKLLQEKRLMGRTKTDSSIPSSYSADYLQRGKDYAEKLRRGNIATLGTDHLCYPQPLPLASV